MEVSAIKSEGRDHLLFSSAGAWVNMPKMNARSFRPCYSFAGSGCTCRIGSFCRQSKTGVNWRWPAGSSALSNWTRERSAINGLAQLFRWPACERLNNQRIDPVVFLSAPFRLSKPTRRIPRAFGPRRVRFRGRVETWRGRSGRAGIDLRNQE